MVRCGRRDAPRLRSLLPRTLSASVSLRVGPTHLGREQAARHSRGEKFRSPRLPDRMTKARADSQQAGQSPTRAVSISPKISEGYGRVRSAHEARALGTLRAEA